MRTCNRRNRAKIGKLMMSGLVLVSKYAGTAQPYYYLGINTVDFGWHESVTGNRFKVRPRVRFYATMPNCLKWTWSGWIYWIVFIVFIALSSHDTWIKRPFEDIFFLDTLFFVVFFFHVKCLQICYSWNMVMMCSSSAIIFPPNIFTLASLDNTMSWWTYKTNHHLWSRYYFDRRWLIITR